MPRRTVCPKPRSQRKERSTGPFERERIELIELSCSSSRALSLCWRGSPLLRRLRPGALSLSPCFGSTRHAHRSCSPRNSRRLWCHRPSFPDPRGNAQSMKRSCSFEGESKGEDGVRPSAGYRTYGCSPLAGCLGPCLHHLGDGCSARLAAYSRRTDIDFSRPKNSPATTTTSFHQAIHFETTTGVNMPTLLTARFLRRLFRLEANVRIQHPSRSGILSPSLRTCTRCPTRWTDSCRLCLPETPWC